MTRLYMYVMLSLYPGKGVICGLSLKTEAKSRSLAMTWISCE